MTEYRLTQTAVVVRTMDDACIPDDPANADRVKYAAWRTSGGVPDPYVKPQVEVDGEARRASFDADATRADLLTRLRSATPAQINSYVDNNVANLAEARALFKKILLVLAAV